MKEKPPQSVPDLYSTAMNKYDSEGADVAEIFQLLLDASAQGDNRAGYAVATWYLHGKPGAVDKDEKAAFDIISRLENSLIAEALFDLAIFYDFGSVVERDEYRAFSLYMRSALLGDSEACRQVAQYYEEGKVVDYDKDLADSWQLRATYPESSVSPLYRVWLRPPKKRARK